MKLISILFLLSPICLLAQSIPSVPFNEKIIADTQSYQKSSSMANYLCSSLFKKQEELTEMQTFMPEKNMVQNDTLYIVTDTVITSTWMFNGHVCVVDTGKCVFNNATAIINGDLVVWGPDARCDILNSSLAMPQAYFYQRSMIAVGNAVLNIQNSTLDFNALPHNLVIAEDAHVILNNVDNSGFRTCGISNNAVIEINGINEAGEFVVTNNSHVQIKNAETVLLWHHFPDGAVITHSFPDGDTVETYDFSSSTTGVSGISYIIDIDSCTDVMWGMMPERNTNIHISNSNLRTIGLWFNGSDSLQVSGLVNQSNYINQTINLSDRTLTLQSCSVRTWSLYTFDTVYVDVSSSILGEIGSFGYSEVYTNTIMVDGSGGYFFASDHTICVAGYTTTGSSVRSEKRGIMIYIYGTIMMGAAEALDTSILIVVQSSLPSDPVYREMACAWYAKIDGPYSCYYGQPYPVIGSAWIDKDPASPLMDFSHYKLSYQKNGDTTWTDIGADVFLEKHHDTLGLWQTNLLPEDGAYLLRLELTDDQTMPFTVEAIVQINVLPEYLNVEENTPSHIKMYPNPANDKVFIEISDKTPGQILIFDELGKLLIDTYYDGGSVAIVDLTELNSGLYYCFYGENMDFIGRLLKD